MTVKDRQQTTTSVHSLRLFLLTIICITSFSCLDHASNESQEQASQPSSMSTPRAPFIPHQNPLPSHAIYFDAGSSGTRVYIYEISSNSAPNTLPDVTVAPRNASTDTELWSMKVTPGISTFSNNLNGIADYLQPLISFVKSKITNTQTLDNTPISFLATAGMRLISLPDQTQILTKVQDTLRQAGLNIPSSDSIKVITGEDEGVYSWIAANYLSHQFNPESTSTSGIMEMGGASLQFTFVPSSPAKAGDQVISLANKIYHLYSTSYTGFGINSARASFNSDACQYIAATNTSPRFTSCTLAILSKFSVTCRSDQESCGLNQIYQPAITGDFYGLSNFYYIPKNNNIALTPLDVNAISTTGTTVCNDLKDPSSTACFDLAYLNILLTGKGTRTEAGFGFTPSSSSHIYPVSQLQNKEINFTLGAAVQAMDKISK